MDILPGETEQDAVGKGGGGHEQELGVLSQIANLRLPAVPAKTGISTGKGARRREIPACRG